MGNTEQVGTRTASALEPSLPALPGSQFQEDCPCLVVFTDLIESSYTVRGLLGVFVKKKKKKI